MREDDARTRYRAFLLRCWEVRAQRPGQPGQWRFQLQDVQTEQKRSFPDLEALVRFLQTELDSWQSGTASVRCDETKERCD